jgi:putative protease
MLIFHPERCTLSVRREVLEMPDVEIGTVTDFFAKPVVAGIELSGTLKTGDKIHIKGSTTDMELAVESMQIERVNITEGKRGDLVGIKVPDRVRRGDKVYKVTE